MANRDDIETARAFATIIEWRKGVDKTLDDHTDRIEGVEKWQTSVNNARKLLIPYMTIGAVVAFVLCFAVFSLRDPVTAAAILKSLMESLL